MPVGVVMEQVVEVRFILHASGDCMVSTYEQLLPLDVDRLS